MLQNEITAKIMLLILCMAAWYEEKMAIFDNCLEYYNNNIIAMQKKNGYNGTK